MELKEERSDLKRLKTELQQTQEELSDSHNEKEALDRALSDRKKKMATLKHTFESEMEDAKQSHESEMGALKERMRKEKLTSSTSISDQVPHTPPLGLVLRKSTGQSSIHACIIARLLLFIRVYYERLHCTCT